MKDEESTAFFGRCLHGERLLARSTVASEDLYLGIGALRRFGRLAVLVFPKPREEGHFVSCVVVCLVKKDSDGGESKIA